jgi:hypothetical protein
MMSQGISRDIEGISSKFWTWMQKLMVGDTPDASHLMDISITWWEYNRWITTFQRDIWETFCGIDAFLDRFLSELVISSILVSEIYSNSWSVVIFDFYTMLGAINMCHLFAAWLLRLSEVGMSMNVDTRRRTRVIHNTVRLIRSQEIHQIIVGWKSFKEWSDASSFRGSPLQKFNMWRQKEISIQSTHLDAWSGESYRKVSSIHLFIYSSIHVFMYLCIYVFMYLCIYVFVYHSLSLSVLILQRDHISD